ncbi:hypothetical protein BH10PLA1_BH10PLA1_06700 [soil metagenome]
MSVMTETAEQAPPADLPTDAAAFWGNTPADLFVAETDAGSEIPVIDQLGAAPFKKQDKGGFPFLGFLASVYEHVSTTAHSELNPTPPVITSSVVADQIESASEEPVQSQS